MTEKCERRPTERAGDALFYVSSVAAQPGDVVATFATYLTAHSAIQDIVLQKHMAAVDFDTIPPLKEKLVLTLYLSLHSPFSEAKNASAYRSQIDDLPRSMQNGIWTDPDTAHTTLHPAVLAKRHALEEQWQALNLGNIAFEVWKWADSIISSRTIGLADARNLLATHAARHQPDDTPKCSGVKDMHGVDLPVLPNLALVPILDLCNHAGKERTARWDMLHDGTIVLVADKDILPNQELTISYGDEKSNAELFFNYGFTLKDNNNWSITLSVPAPPEVEEQDEAEFWTAVREHYGLSDTMRFSSFSKELQTAVELDQVNDAAALLSLSDDKLATLMLGTSLQVYSSGTLERVFDEEGATASTKERKTLESSAINLLRGLIEERITQVANLIKTHQSTTARQLLESELHGYQQVLTACIKTASIDDPVATD